MKIQAMFFSPTSTTKKIVTTIKNELATNLKNHNLEHELLPDYDFTLLSKRNIETYNISFSKDTIVIFGVPVYAGRVPNILLNFLEKVKADSSLCIPIVLYGNRNYDDALIELRDILSNNGFIPVAAGAFIGEHAFSRTLAKARPDQEDIESAVDFTKLIYKKIFEDKNISSVEVRGHFPYRPYYRPLNPEKQPVDIRKVKPKTNSNCNNCKICVSVCPMNSIDEADVTLLNGICIKCGACIKSCPAQAKYFDDIDFIRHKEELEIEFAQRRCPEVFI